MQPDIGLSLARGGHQRGQTQKGKATNQPELPKSKKAKFQQHPNTPQEPIFIPFDHRKGLKQQMIEIIQKLPQESHQRMINYMHYLLTLLPEAQPQQPIQTSSGGDQPVPAGKN